jgi:hypothetical protein
MRPREDNNVSPTSIDWAVYRPTITQLYIEDGLRLADVVDVMKREHGLSMRSFNNLPYSAPDCLSLTDR